MSTIKDVARRTGLSLSTISKYLNGGNVREENRLLRSTRRSRSWAFPSTCLPAASRPNRSMTVGVLLPTISSPFWPRGCVAGADFCGAAAMNASSAAMIFDREQELGKLRFFARRRRHRLRPEQRPLKSFASASASIPVVLIDRSLENAAGDTVVVDNLNAVYMAVEHLIGADTAASALSRQPQTISTARGSAPWAIAACWRITVCRSMRRSLPPGTTISNPARVCSAPFSICRSRRPLCLSPTTT